MKRLISLALMVWALSIAAFAQSGAVNCKGTVVDSEDEPIVGATVAVTGGKVVGVTDVDGRFSVMVPANAATLQITYVGFKPAEVAVARNVGTVRLEISAKMLDDVVVTQSLARTRETPVALSQINASEIEYKLGNQEFPEVLKTTPGVWTTKDGGGFGDAKTNMRGFKSENVAVMVNGIPINDMESGRVYWSNWAGLSDVASNIQTQRGLGAALLSAPSVGGTINITTRSTDAIKGGSVWYGMGNDGMNNYGIKFSTGLMDNGWAVTVLGSRKWGDGYVQGTNYLSYNYFVNVSKIINDRHQLSFTAFGAPQEHDQRSNQDGLTINEWQTYAKRVMDGSSPYRYNPTYGFDRQGQRKTSQHNTYHKPQISLAHIWQIDNKSSLSTTFYFSIASGSGYSGQGRKIGSVNYRNYWYGASKGIVNKTFRNADGTFAYGEVQAMNEASETGSNMIMSKSNNSHQWYGLVSTYKNEFFDRKLKFTGGIDLRYYIGEHNNRIIDLYDGEYYIDDVNRSAVKPENRAIYNKNNFDWVNEKLGVGDIVYRNYNSYTQQEGFYAQAEYTTLNNQLNLVLSGSLSNTGYRRWDKFYYDKKDGKSAWHNYLGGTAKFGINYNIDRHNNVYGNAGFISRAPFFARGVFISKEVSNAVNPNPTNEKVISYELGYGFHSAVFSLNLNGYYTKWLDKTTSRSVDLNDGSYGVFNMTGVDARHMGIELNFVYEPVKWFTLEGMLSMADNEWSSNARGYFYDLNGQPLASLTPTLAAGIEAPDHLSAVLQQKGVKVGGSAMTTASISTTFRPFKGWRLTADWVMNANNYTDYQISDSNFNPGSDIKVGKPWRIPWGQQLDLSASYSFKIGNLDARISGNVYNVFNYNYVVDGWTDATAIGTWENAYRILYSFGRTYACKLKINF